MRCVYVLTAATPRSQTLNSLTEQLADLQNTLAEQNAENKRLLDALNAIAEKRGNVGSLRRGGCTRVARFASTIPIHPPGPSGIGFLVPTSVGCLECSLSEQ